MAGPIVPISLREFTSYSLVCRSSSYGGNNLELTLCDAAAHPVTVRGKVLGATGYSKHEVASGDR